MNLATLDHFFTRFTVHCSYLGGISRAACVRLGVVQKGSETVAGRITWRAFPSWLRMNHLFSLSLQPLPTLRKHLFLYPNGAAHLSNGDICSQSHVQPGMVVHDPNSQFKATRGYITTFSLKKKEKKEKKSKYTCFLRKLCPATELQAEQVERYNDIRARSGAQVSRDLECCPAHLTPCRRGRGRWKASSGVGQ